MYANALSVGRLYSEQLWNVDNEWSSASILVSWWSSPPKVCQETDGNSFTWPHLAMPPATWPARWFEVWDFGTRPWWPQLNNHVTAKTYVLLKVRSAGQAYVQLTGMRMCFIKKNTHWKLAWGLEDFDLSVYCKSMYHKKYPWRNEIRRFLENSQPWMKVTHGIPIVKYWHMTSNNIIKYGRCEFTMKFILASLLQYAENFKLFAWQKFYSLIAGYRNSVISMFGKLISHLFHLIHS